jgi:hypothetical protein
MEQKNDWKSRNLKSLKKSVVRPPTVYA